MKNHEKDPTGRWTIVEPSGTCHVYTDYLMRNALKKYKYRHSDQVEFIYDVKGRKQTKKALRSGYLKMNPNESTYTIML
jgi:hypothetical protein